MRITEITMSRSVKVNTGNYESTDAFCSMRAVVDDPDLEEITDEDRIALAARVREAVLDEVVHIVHEKGMKGKDGSPPSRGSIAKRWGL